MIVALLEEVDDAQALRRDVEAAERSLGPPVPCGG